jgi:hypothetical protein
MPRVVIKSSFMWGAIKLALHMEYPPSLRLTRRIRLRVNLILSLLSLSSNIFEK